MPLDFGKAQRQLEALASSGAGAGSSASAAFVVLSGALSPVHQAHVQVLQAARRAIELRTGVPVIAGFLSPSSDQYVRDKLGGEAIPLQERSLLCRLACEDSEWMEVCDWGVASSSQVTRTVGEQLSQILAWTGGVCWNLVGWQVAGADFAARASLWRKPTPTVCVSRGAEDNATVRASTAEVPGHFLLVDIESLEDISSTAIRTLAAAGEWEELAATGWLAPAVLRRLRGSPDVTLDDSEQAVELSAKTSKKAKPIQEKRLITRFLDEVAQDTGKYCFGIKDTMRALGMGACETLIVWEGLELKRIVLRNDRTDGEEALFLTPEEAKNEKVYRDPATNTHLDVVDNKLFVDWIVEACENFGAELELITDRSSQGSQFCKGFGGIGGLLRYRVEFEGSAEPDLGEEDSDDDFM